MHFLKDFNGHLIRKTQLLLLHGEHSVTVKKRCTMKSKILNILGTQNLLMKQEKKIRFIHNKTVSCTEKKMVCVRWCCGVVLVMQDVKQQ